MPYKDSEKYRSFKRQWHLDRKAENKRIADEARANGCAICGEQDLCCLSFHHKDSTQKSFTIGSTTRGLQNPERLKSEIAKCVVLCENCHRKVHAGHLELP